MENDAICPLCERQHRVGNGWAFCPRDLKARVQDRDLQLSQSCAGLRSVQEREEAFWRFLTLDGSDDLWRISDAARLVLPTVMARLLDARADPNLQAPHLPCSVPDPQVNDMETPLHEVLRRLECDMETPLHWVLRRLEFNQWYGNHAMSGIAKAVPDCVKLLVRYKADLSLVDAWDRTPSQVVLQHRRAGVHFATGLTRGVLKLTEECVEIMGAEARATMPSRDAEAATDLRHPFCKYCMRSLSSLEHRNLCAGACYACYWKGFVVWCVQCDAWRPLVTESEAAAKTCPKCQVLLQPSRYFCQSCGDPHADCECPKEDCEHPKICKSPKEDTNEKAGKACCSFCKKPLTVHPGRSKEVPYCSDECRYPKCPGRAPNGKACQKERTGSRAYGGNKPRWDQQNQWYCQQCRDISQPSSSASPAKRQQQSTVEGESLETKSCHLCSKKWLASDTERQGSHYYCRTCLDEQFICGGPKGCGDKYKRRDGQFDWSHLKELQDQNKKRKNVFCKECRISKETKQTQ